MIYMKKIIQNINNYFWTISGFIVMLDIVYFSFVRPGNSPLIVRLFGLMLFLSSIFLLVKLAFRFYCYLGFMDVKIKPNTNTVDLIGLLLSLLLVVYLYFKMSLGQLFSLILVLIAAYTYVFMVNKLKSKKL